MGKTSPITTSDSSPPVADLRPTVFISLGGLAGQVLQSLRRRLARRFGDEANVAMFQMLALDTDRDALQAVQSKAADGYLTADETLHLPLRKSADYRSSSDEILCWLSRRWLYNIPRSLRTEGLRPLGRLAFVDHRQAIGERIGAAMEEIAAHAAESPWGPRVYVITSIDGGTGGGMLLDVAYAVRQHQERLELPANGLCGLMLHATFAGSPGNDLRNANAYATLTELNHFMQGGATYRAGPMEVLPAGDVSEPPFAHAYFVGLGDDVSADELTCEIERVADYLYLASACSLGSAIDQARSRINKHLGTSHDQRPSSHEVGYAGAVQLRSFALHAIRFNKRAITLREADRLCERVLERWLGDRDERHPTDCGDQPPDFQLDDILARLQAIADKVLGGSADANFRALVAAGPNGPSIVRDDDPAGPFGDDLRQIHSVLGMPGQFESGGYLTPLESQLRDAAKKLGTAMGRWGVESVSAIVEQPKARLAAAATAVNLCQGRLRDSRRSAEEAYRDTYQDAISLLSKLQRGELPREKKGWLGRFTGAAGNPEDCLLEYCRLRLRSMIFKSAMLLLQDIASELTAFAERLAALRQSIERLADALATASAGARAIQSEPSAWSESQLTGKLGRLAEPTFVDEFDETLQQECLKPRGGLVAMADGSSDQWDSLKITLAKSARERVSAFLAGIDAGLLLARANPTAGEIDALLRSAADIASVALPGTGRAEKLFVVVPQGSASTTLVEALHRTLPDATVIPSSEEDLVFYREVGEIALTDAANALVADRGTCAEVARRVLTRHDVAWIALETA